MPATAPAIYVGNKFPPDLTMLPRLLALAIAAGSLAVLLTAAWLVPSADGVGTHQALGMQPCGFLMQTGLPCPGCGMTTSFSYAVRGRMIASFIAQPFGMLLCVLTAAAFWSALYVAVTGRPAYKLLRLVPMTAHVILWPTLTLVGWVWKIVLMSWH